MSSQYQKSLDEVNETFQFYVSMLEERKAEVVRDLEQAYSGKQVQLSVFSQKAQDTVEKILQVLAWPPFTAILFWATKIVFSDIAWNAGEDAMHELSTKYFMNSGIMDSK